MVCLSACWDTHPPGKADPLARRPPCAVHAGRYGQQAGGMHPTGMQFLLTVILCMYVQKRRMQQNRKIDFVLLFEHVFAMRTDLLNFSVI